MIKKFICQEKITPPRDAREIVWQFKRYLRELDSSNRRFIPMILARSVSEGARDFLQEEQFAYHDLSSTLYKKHSRSGPQKFRLW